MSVYCQGGDECEEHDLDGSRLYVEWVQRYNVLTGAKAGGVANFEFPKHYHVRCFIRAYRHAREVPEFEVMGM